MLAWENRFCSYLFLSFSFLRSPRTLCRKDKQARRRMRKKKSSRSVTSVYGSYLGRRFLSPVLALLLLCRWRTVFLQWERRTSTVCLRVAPTFPLRPADADGHYECLEWPQRVYGHQGLQMQIRERGHCRCVPGFRDCLLLC